MVSSVNSGSGSLIERIGIPRSLLWGFIALLVFMIGDGLETGYLASFLHDEGFSESRVAFTMTVYGVTVAIASWLSAALSEVMGPRKVVFLGAFIWFICHIGFMAGIHLENYPMLLGFYALRGFGYPLFAYAFLVWVTSGTEPSRLGTAVGWFWFAYSAGFAALSPLFAKLSLAWVGPFNSLWVGFGVVLLGALIMIMVRDPHGAKPESTQGENPVLTLVKSVSVLWREPRIGAGAFIRMVNSIPQYGFIAFMPIYYTETLDFELQQWLTVSSVMFISNIFFNLATGIAGDRIGLARVVRHVGSFGCAITTLLFFYIPSITESYSLALLFSAIYGATLAGFVPLSALMPLMLPERPGSAMAGLNLGSGLAVAVGPGIVAAVHPFFGAQGVFLVYAGLYLAAGLLSYALPVNNPRPDQEQESTSSESGEDIAAQAIHS